MHVHAERNPRQIRWIAHDRNADKSDPTLPLVGPKSIQPRGMSAGE
jgi:hypothetical protein